MMKSTLVAVTLLAAMTSGAHDEQWTAWAEQTARLRRLACGPPREHIVLLPDLGLQVETSEVYSPAATVLHRCVHSDVCCGVGDTWDPAEVQQVSLVFHVRDLVVADRSSLRTVVVSNHTRCGCRPSADVFNVTAS